LEDILPTKFILIKIQDGGGRHIEIYIYVHYSVAIAYICAKFDTEATNRVLEPDLPSKFTPAKNPRWREPPF